MKHLDSAGIMMCMKKSCSASARGMDEMTRKSVGKMTEMKTGAIMKIKAHCKEMEGMESEKLKWFQIIYQK